jgi:opacity protein-like surface antigen
VAEDSAAAVAAVIDRMRSNKPMSKDNKRCITATLAAATCSLLGSGLPQPVQAQEEPGWDFNTALLYYGEDNDRVQDLSLDMLARRTYVDDRILTIGLTLDTLTGATPNGAIPQDVAQTFTQPSGNDVYVTPPGELPIDDTFRDTRAAFAVDWSQPLGRLYQVNVGASASKEYDYLHLGLNAKISRDFNQRNTTLSAGFAYSADELDPVGGTPMGDAVDDENDDDGLSKGPKQTKDVFDAVLGLTQIISKNMLVQLNYSYSDSSG